MKTTTNIIFFNINMRITRKNKRTKRGKGRRTLVRGGEHTEKKTTKERVLDVFKNLIDYFKNIGVKLGIPMMNRIKEILYSIFRSNPNTSNHAAAVETLKKIQKGAWD